MYCPHCSEETDIEGTWENCGDEVDCPRCGGLCEISSDDWGDGDYYFRLEAKKRLTPEDIELDRLKQVEREAREARQKYEHDLYFKRLREELPTALTGMEMVGEEITRPTQEVYHLNAVYTVPGRAEHIVEYAGDYSKERFPSVITLAHGKLTLKSHGGIPGARRCSYAAHVVPVK